MAVSLTLSRSGSIDDVDTSYGVCFEDDGNYWFMFPYFEKLFKQTGQMVDLYDDALFPHAQLHEVLAVIEEAKQSVEQQPKEWDVQLGWRGSEKVYSKASQTELKEVLNDFIVLVQQALAMGKGIVATGD